MHPQPLPCPTPQHLVLLGVTHAHLHVLRGLAQSRPAQLQLTVVTSADEAMYLPTVADLVAGQHTPDQCQLPLAALIERCGARHEVSGIQTLDAQARRLTLTQGRSVNYDWLSLDLPPTMHRETIEAAMPGARAHALFYRPVERFARLWSQLAALHPEQPLHLAVVGGGLDAVELALACHHGIHRLSQRPAGSRVSLVTGGTVPGAGESTGLRQRMVQALKSARITVLPERCTGFALGEVQLANGARLRCDAPILATDTPAPPWLRDSGLALTEAGALALNAGGQSQSHGEVFAAEAHSTSGSGPALLASLRAAWSNQPLTTRTQARSHLKLMSCGNGRALGAWGGLSFEGRWVWALKRWLDHRSIGK